MKRKLKWTLITVFAAIASLFVFSGCSFNRTIDEIKNTYGLTAQVTYHANGGQFGVNADDTVKDIYYKENTKVLEIGAEGIIFSAGKTTVTRKGYELEGWYYPELKNGEVQYLDEAKTQVKLDKDNKVDFSTLIQANEHWEIYASWKALVAVDVKVVCAEGETFSGTDLLNGKRENLSNGSIAYSYEFDDEGKVDERTAAPLKSVDGKTHTFLAFYADEACTQSVAWPISMPAADENGETANPVIYAKYITGDWTVLKTAEDVLDEFLPLAEYDGYRFYLFNDIDMEGVTSYSLMGALACELQGNGHTISNLSIEVTGVKSVDQIENLSLFGKIEATAKMQNVTFENVNVSVVTTKPQSEQNTNVHFAFTSIAEEAKANVTGVTVSGKITVQKSANFNFSASGYFGGYATDTAYTAECPDGIKVESGEIEIKE